MRYNIGLLGSLSYDCYSSVLRHLERDQRSIDKPTSVAADPTPAEAASPRSGHTGMQSALHRRVTMETNGVSKRGGTPSQTAAAGCVCLHDLDCYGDCVIAAYSAYRRRTENPCS